MPVPTLTPIPFSPSPGTGDPCASSEGEQVVAHWLTLISADLPLFLRKQLLTPSLLTMTIKVGTKLTDTGRHLAIGVGLDVRA
jgi:hypothetical protein